MLKIARPVSFLLLSVALCSSGVIFAANETTTPKVGISQQQASLKGVVEDEFGPVAGASVVVKGTTNGTVTDMNGNFVLEVKKGDVIVISFIGYLTQEIKYNGEQTIKVSLKEDTQKLDEVVVIGYGTQKKVNLTGAVASVGSEELKERVNTDVLASVQGQVPGVTIINRQGSISINMRGRGNLGTSSPLFVIDGAIADATFFSNLDPNSIESVSFLKDAASSAIYGSRAAYGVVLVKTKDGKEGDVKVTYDGTVSMKIATYTPKVLSSEWYARLSNEAAFNENPNAEMPYSDEEIEMFRNGSNPDMYPNTNWYDLVLDDLAVMTKHSVSVSGGNKVKYFTSLGYMYDDKFTPGASANRYNMTTNLSSDITSWLSWRSNFKYIQNTNNTESGGIGYTELLTVPSTYVARQSNGEWGSYEGGNPAALVNMQRNPLRRLEEGGWNNNKSQNTLIDLALDIKPVKGLTLTGQMIYKAYDYKGKTYEANRNKIKDFVTGSELNGTDVTDQIRLPEISLYASAVSAHPAVRAHLLEMQRKLARENNVVMDGRDIGTVVLPHAGAKVFLTAAPEARARRRLLELKQRGQETELETVLRDIVQRDEQDRNRAVAPLRQAEDAVLLDTTELGLEESLKALISLVKGRLAQ